MNTIDRRIAELRAEISSLRVALEVMGTPSDRDHIFKHINVCIVEYTELVNQRLSALIPTDQPLTERHIGKDTK